MAGLYDAPTQQQRDALKAEHGKLWEFTVDGNVVLCRKLKRAEWKHIQEQVNNELRMLQAADNTTKVVVVYPDAVGLELLLDEYPGASERISSDAIRIAKGEATKEGKGL